MTADERIDALLKKAGIEEIAIIHDVNAYEESAKAQIKEYIARLDPEDPIQTINNMFDIISELMLDNHSMVCLIDKMEAVIYNLINERDNKNDTPIQ